MKLLKYMIINLSKRILSITEDKGHCSSLNEIFHQLPGLRNTSCSSRELFVPRILILYRMRKHHVLQSRYQEPEVDTGLGRGLC